MTLTRIVARPMLASMFVVGATNALKNAEPLARRAKPVTDKVNDVSTRVAPQLPLPTNPEALVRLNAVAQLVGAAGLASGKAPRFSAMLLAGSLVPTTAAGHRFWEETDPATRAAQRMHFFKNISMLGGLLIAAADTDGKPGVAWRARHAASGARKQARHLRRTAKLEAKLAAKGITS